MPEFILCLESFVYIWSHKVWVSFVTLVGLFIRFLNPNQFVRFTKSKTWLLDDFNRSMLKSPITYIFFYFSQFMKGLHNAFLEDIHVIMGVSVDNSNNDIFFVEANFNPKGFTTIKRFRQFLNVFSVYCVFNISAHSTCFCRWVTVEKSVSMHLMIRWMGVCAIYSNFINSNDIRFII